MFITTILPHLNDGERDGNNDGDRFHHLKKLELTYQTVTGAAAK